MKSLNEIRKAATAFSKRRKNSYAANGNNMRYLDANGNTAASYTYDAFGNTIAQSGPFAGLFRHRFSTKYFDSETGNYLLAG